jgi:hypothetical protein
VVSVGSTVPRGVEPRGGLKQFRDVYGFKPSKEFPGTFTLASEVALVWNIWGRSCVVVHLKKSVLQIGTDDTENLVEFLEGKIGSKRQGVS